MQKGRRQKVSQRADSTIRTHVDAQHYTHVAYTQHSTYRPTVAHRTYPRTCRIIAYTSTPHAYAICSSGLHGRPLFTPPSATGSECQFSRRTFGQNFVCKVQGGGEPHPGDHAAAGPPTKYIARRRGGGNLFVFFFCARQNSKFHLDEIKFHLDEIKFHLICWKLFYF